MEISHGVIMQVDEDKFPALPSVPAPSPAPAPPSPPPAASRPPKGGHDYGLWGPPPQQDPNPSTANFGTLSQQQSSWDHPDPIEGGWGQEHPQKHDRDQNPDPYHGQAIPKQGNWGQEHPQQDGWGPNPDANLEKDKPAKQWQQHWDQTQQQSECDRPDVHAQGIWEQPQGSTLQEFWQQNHQVNTWDQHHQGTLGQPSKHASTLNQPHTDAHAPSPYASSPIDSPDQGWFDEHRLGWESGLVPPPDDPNVPKARDYPEHFPTPSNMGAPQDTWGQDPTLNRGPSQDTWGQDPAPNQGPPQDSWGPDPSSNPTPDGWGQASQPSRGDGPVPDPPDYPPETRAVYLRRFGQGPSGIGEGSNQTQWDPSPNYRVGTGRYSPSSYFTIGRQISLLKHIQTPNVFKGVSLLLKVFGAA